MTSVIGHLAAGQLSTRILTPQPMFEYDDCDRAAGKFSTSASDPQLTPLNATTAIDRLVASSLSSSTSTLSVINFKAFLPMAV
jgi:hypothetical protein